MKAATLVLSALILALLLAGCIVTGADEAPFPTLTPVSGASPTGGVTPSALPPATVTSLPTITAVNGVTATATAVFPTVPAATLAPTVLPTATATITPTPTRAATRPPATGQPTWAGTDDVMIFLIALGDNGANGPLVGCGDSVVGLHRQIERTRGPLRAALNLLLSFKDQTVPSSSLYNALYQSNLVLDDVAIVNGTAKIEISGTLMLGGICDNPRVKAQIEYTARQFSTVKAVDITINGRPIDEVLSQQ